MLKIKAENIILSLSGAILIGLILLPIKPGFSKEFNKERNQSSAKTLARPAPEYKAHNIGTLWNVVTNYGGMGDPEYGSSGRPSMEWPGGGSNNYLYDASLMVTTMVNGEKYNSTYYYSKDEWKPSEGSSFLMGNAEVSAVSTPRSIQDSWAEFDDMASETDHFPLGIKIIRRGLSWSMPEVDDFLAYEIQVINTGLNGNLRDVFVSFWYDLDVASIDVSDSHIDDLVDFDGWDGPDTGGDEVDWVDPHDLDGDGLTGYDSYGWPFAEPMNVESDGADVGYQPEKAEPDGIFDENTLLIDSEAPVVFADAAVTIGDYEIEAGDTLRNGSGQPIFGYKVPRNTSYIYDYDNPTSSDNDTGERNLTPMATGFAGGRLIYADPTSADYLFEPADSLHKRIVRTYSHQWWNWESDPDNDAEFYDYTTGQHEFSQGFKFLPNPFAVGAPTFDYRFLHTAGPFDITAGDTIRVVWVEAVGEGLEGLRKHVDAALEAYYSGSEHSSPYNPSDFDSDIHWQLPAPPPTPNLSYSPGDYQVKLVWDNIAEITPDTKTGLIDFAGYKVYRAIYSPSNWTLIHAMFDVTQFAGNIIYVTNTDGDTLGSVLKSEATGLSNAFVDDGGAVAWNGDVIEPPVNGIPYFYALVAFDTGDPVSGLPAAESGKNNYRKNADGAPLTVVPKVVYESMTDAIDLKKIKVVPNPYKGTGAFEDIYKSRINFINLPPAAKISIYSMTGDLIETISHNDGTDSEGWDLLSRNNQAIVSGLYLYVVESADEYHIGKFVVVR